jgi:hypothetical protein
LAVAAHPFHQQEAFRAALHPLLHREAVVVLLHREGLVGLHLL